MKQKKIIIIGAALVAIVLIVTGVAAALLTGTSGYATMLAEGYRYLQEGDYNNAIVQFRMAIEEDETREDAYYGLYQAYLHSGQNSLAATTLRMGITACRSVTLQNLLIQLQATNQTSADTSQSGSSGSETMEDNKGVVAVLNTDILKFFGSANYGDYCVQYGATAGTMSSGQYRRHIEALGATLLYYDSSTTRVLDAGRGVPYNQFMPNEIQLDNIASLFGGASRVTFDMLKGFAGISDAKMEGNTITFRYLNCDVRIVCKEAGVITSGCENYIVPSEDKVQEEGSLVLAATVIDVTTGAPVSGAKVRLYEGYNTMGEAEEGTTDSAGRLSLNTASSGNHTVVIEKDGYITEQFDVFILSNTIETQETFAISPKMSDDAIRIVLTWNGSPSDLDSYLFGTSSDGTYIDVNFTNKEATNSSNKQVAILDVDDVNGFGPETTTLMDTKGSYEFVVDDFTNSGTIASSGATVKIYVGSSLYETVNIAEGITDMWHVCTIVDGVITITNRAY